MSDSSTWTMQRVLDWAAADFQSKAMERPRFEAEILLAHVLGLARIDLYTQFDRPLDPVERAAYREAISKRRSGYPVAYITGHREFWSLDFEVTPQVLVPRPETELLVETALKHAPREGRILDLCTGSGCVAIALATEMEDLTVDAVDRSKGACDIARRNAEKHDVSNRVTVLEGNLFDPLPKNATYPLIVSNPPYVLSNEMPLLPMEVQQEPAVALDGGEDGLDIVRQILENAPSRLETGGVLMVEVDPRQTQYLAGDLGPERLGVPGEILPDLAGLERVVVWQMK